MNLTALPELLLSWVKNQGVALLQSAKAEPATFQPGQQYEGKVVDNLVNGRHLVKVGGQMLDMNLPAKTQPGDSVRLTYMNAGPRPTFLLNQGAVTPVQQVQISNTAQQVNALLRLAQTPGSGAMASSAMVNSAVANSAVGNKAVGGSVVSSGAVTNGAVGNKAASDTSAVSDGTADSGVTNNVSTSQAATKTTLLGAALSGDAPGSGARIVNVPAASARSAASTTTASTTSAAPSVASTSAVSTSAPVNAARGAVQAAALIDNLASPAGTTDIAPARTIVANVVMLQNHSAVVPSTTAALTGPNSGLLEQAVGAPRAAIPSSTTLSVNTLVELPSAANHMLPVRLSQTVSESGMFYESHLAKWSTGSLSLESILREPQARLGQENLLPASAPELGGMPEEAARLAGRQLQMLEGAPFLWQGQAWPGQAMDWLVREEAGGEGGGEDAQAGSEWVTELNLTLPRMGTVHAQLGLAGDQLRVRLQTTDASTRDSLIAALPLLAKGFEASGLKPVEMQVAVPNGEPGGEG
ncbi:MAG: hypothetical protein B7Y41_14025 [Hydrogenophilales bacterium 28-61-23]|nr:MAG: hypothetical protein B7Y41_14025 [Hydrogenophilales bacterium 28-61-23]